MLFCFDIAKIRLFYGAILIIMRFLYEKYSFIDETRIFIFSAGVDYAFAEDF